MKISAIIVTYNRPDALEAILRSILVQRELPSEVVIADDGSGPATAAVVQKYRELFPVVLKQVWHEDRGFRGSAIRNRAIRESSGEYLVFSDGDLLFHPSFFRDFRKMAAPGQASIGSRVFLTRAATAQYITAATTLPLENSISRSLPPLPGLFSSGIARNRFNGCRIPLLTPWFPEMIFSERTRGGLLGVWKKDLEAVNGWNEDFTGWGLEDTELVARLHFNGVALRKLKMSALCYHLWHPEANRQQLERNRLLLEQTITRRITWCENGLVTQ